MGITTSQAATLTALTRFHSNRNLLCLADDLHQRCLFDGAQTLVRAAHIRAGTRRAPLLISLISLSELDTQPGTVLRRRPELRRPDPQLTRRVLLPRPMPGMDEGRVKQL